ncbi:cupin domain-containing protein [Alkalihalobacillus pseudalcaliphilus]|uniref:cupin domain-containing protein n=1 Tax=Alkalihalobacillus pseudalcaliphilus TaxID=79884 RepID=UPI00064D99A5|nr:cupin domain-containing protein [Alkalihalobacillus pseudalcaliphilus]KMK74977.1 cupin [Alkalihalobacillus pseudalcaliphilus]
MEIFSFTKELGKKVTHFDSNFIMSKITVIEEETRIGGMYLEAGGVIGYHQAKSPQLLLVVKGEGLVKGGSNEYLAVSEGDAVYWEEGEWHETKTDSGLTAIVLESKELSPGLLMERK